MESHEQAPPPAIRTAMRMSRYISPTPKPIEIPNFAASLCLSDEIAEDESVQSAKLRSLPSVPTRSQPWGQYREALRSQLYQDWEKDECVLEEEVPVQCKVSVCIEEYTRTEPSLLRSLRLTCDSLRKD